MKCEWGPMKAHEKEEKKSYPPHSTLVLLPKHPACYPPYLCAILYCYVKPYYYFWVLVWVFLRGSCPFQLFSSVQSGHHCADFPIHTRANYFTIRSRYVY